MKYYRMSIRIADLHEAYGSASLEDRIAMANLGAVCWGAVKDALYGQWQTALTAEESEKAEKWREEGRKELGQLLKTKGGEVAALSAQLAAAEAAVEGLRGSIAAEAAKHAEALVETRMKDVEIQHMKDINRIKDTVSSLKEELATHNMLKENNKKLEDELKQLKGTPGGVYNKSSQAIGKAGEGQVMDILTYGVCPRFQYSTVKDVTSEGHAADFHLFVHGPKRELIKILIDSKKYTKSIEKKEILKLHADVDADDDAKAGMMISLTSTIDNTRMFSIKYTDKGRPVVYINFTDIDVNMHVEVVCWAVHVLQSIAIKGDIDERLHMIEEIDIFLESLDISVREIDGVIRQQTKALSALRDMKSNLIRKIQGFRESRGDDDENDEIEHVEDSDGGGCEALLKTTGKKCGRKVSAGSWKCGVHAERSVKREGGLKK